MKVRFVFMGGRFPHSWRFYVQRTGASIVLNLVLNMPDYLAQWSGTAGPHQVLGKCINLGSAPF